MVTGVRQLGLPVSDADEERLEVALLAAAADDYGRYGSCTSRPWPRNRAVDAVAGADATPVLAGTRQTLRAAVAAELRRPICGDTRGAQRITDADAVSPDQSCLWGFGGAASLEHPQSVGGLADLSEGTADEWSLLINRVAAQARSEDRFALRDRAVHVPRLVRRLGHPIAKPLTLRDDATYLVTGGLGSVGLEIAGYLAAHGARYSGADRQTPVHRCRARAHRCAA